MTRASYYFGAPTALVAAVGMAALVLLVLASAGARPAQAATTFTVNSTADPGDGTCDATECTLREAINAADTTSGADTITFSVSGTIPLQSTLTMNSPDGLTIDGQNASITVSGRGTTRVFTVNPLAKLALQNLTVARGSAVGAFGGGIENVAGTVTVTNSTFSDNSAQFGGGIFNEGGTVTVTNSTFSGNSADLGGGIFTTGGTVMVTNSTFSGNSAQFASGIFNNGVPATLRNTIVANSTSGGNCGGTTTTDGGYNISTDGTCAFTAQTSTNGETRPLFAGGLANNGGPTQTIALHPTSPAVNAIPQGTNGCGTTITTDQRGVTRPQFGACDIGAYELAQASPPPPLDKDKKKQHQKKKKHKHHKKKHHHKGGGGGGISQSSGQG